ncbi:MAG: hypothetical protein QOF51_3755 [Chloroflexota bacterium]|jgi:hypothetical protein|nr:hypothetical protein [Chloroflexota bacterium]
MQVAVGQFECVQVWRDDAVDCNVLVGGDALGTVVVEGKQQARVQERADERKPPYPASSGSQVNPPPHPNPRAIQEQDRRPMTDFVLSLARARVT